MNGFLLNEIYILVYLLTTYEGEASWNHSRVLQNGKEYHWFNGKAAWKSAETKCSEKGWTLATARSSRDETELVRFVKQYKKDTWIGLNLTSNTGYFGVQTGVWSDGTPYHSDESFSDWRSEEPKDTKDNDCVQLLYDKIDTKWDNYYCTAGRNFVCESNPGFKKLGNKIIDDMKTLSANKNNLEAVSYLLDMLLNHTDPDKFTHKLSSEILESFGSFIDRFTDGNFTVKRTNFDIEIIVAEGVSPITFKESEGVDGIQLQLSSALVKETFERVKNFSKRLQVGSVIYRNTGLFQADPERYPREIQADKNETFRAKCMKFSPFGEEPQLRSSPHMLSNVISAQISNLSMSNLTSPVRISIKNTRSAGTAPRLKNLKQLPQSFQCVFWDSTAREWSNEGCVTEPENINEKYNESVTCRCKKMGNFVFAVVISYTYGTNYMHPLTYVGCLLSALFHFATAIIILSFRNLRRHFNRRIILNISINLGTANIVFIAGIERNKSEAACLAASVLFHYFLLTAWSWMVLEGVYLFRSLILKQMANDKIFLLIGGLLSYVLPGISVALTILLAKPYLSVKYCWLEPNALQYGVVIPVGVFLGINIFVFAAATYAVTCGSKLKTAPSGSGRIRQTMRRIVYTIFLLGIPSIFGFLMLLAQHNELKNAFSVLFVACDALQGLVFFLGFAISDEEVRKKMRSGAAELCSRTIKPSHKEEHVTTLQEIGTRSTLPGQITTDNDSGTRFPFRSGWY